MVFGDTLHLPTLLAVASLVMAASAGVLTVVGLTQRVHRGFWWWTAAQWLGFVAAVLRLGGEQDWALRLAAETIAVTWPIVVLTGTRRFHSREPMRGGPAPDFAIAVGAGVLLALCYSVSRAAAHTIFFFSLITALVDVYAAWVMWSAPSRRSSGPFAALIGMQAVSALTRLPRMVEALHAWPAPDAPQLQAGTSLAVLFFLLAAVIVQCLCLAMTYERTENDLRESHQRLRLLANVDMLTEVPNRRHLQELAEQILSTAREPAALMLFDIDRFKQINDEHGHAAGDAALRLVAQRASEALRANDVLGRLGGDEFVALLPQTTVEQALRGAERMTHGIVRAAEALGLPPMSISVGVVPALPNESLSNVLLRADRALYEAKRQGRGRAVLDAGDIDTASFTESRTLGLSAN